MGNAQENLKRMFMGRKAKERQKAAEIEASLAQGRIALAEVQQARMAPVRAYQESSPLVAYGALAGGVALGAYAYSSKKHRVPAALGSLFLLGWFASDRALRKISTGVYFDPPSKT